MTTSTSDDFLDHLRQLGLDPDKPLEDWTEAMDRILTNAVIEKLRLLRQSRPDDKELARAVETLEVFERRRRGFGE
jgi:hypothetical protein